MRLLQAPRSPYCIKVRIVIAHLNLSESVSLVTVNPWTDESLRRVNPLCKVPTLVLDDGTTLHDSPVICDFLNDHVSGDLIPSFGTARWEVLRRQATADGLAEAVIRRHVERLGPENDRSRAVIARQESAIASALSALEAEMAAQNFKGATLGELAICAAVSYLDRRSPEITWRESHRALSLWYDAFVQRPATAYALASAI